ncbi:MAG TPA: ATP-binding cassette domain-containing protein [Planctomycetota bacterium]|nr:ATP-binding cassette domain-containing protein [Planctomycetota bacterium]
MIAIENLCVRAGAFALDGISFEIRSGQHGVLMGKTGCGKTTILEAVCGLRAALSGRVILMNRDVTHLPPAQRGIGYVPQDRALFSTMTVAENIGFALALRKFPPGEIETAVRELASWLGISALLSRKPRGLSGGEAQRVALARALAARPDVLIFDEPLSALDEDTRGEICELLERVREHSKATILHVTHSKSEAARLADVIYSLNEGKIERIQNSKFKIQN